METTFKNLDNLIAIIGISGRFPGADSVRRFWLNLAGGVESVTFFSDEELLDSGVDPALVARQDYVKARPVLEGVELFDASFFGYSPREAAIMAPHHRLFLETAWEATEDAGYDCTRFAGRIGLFAGAGMNSYLLNNLAANASLRGAGDMLPIILGNDKDFLATRASYKLDLKGPSVTVQSACSTSLVAVHLACQSLLNGESDMALAGGVAINVPQESGYLFQDGGIVSPDGHCRAFDARAGGTIFGSGIGVVVMKRLTDALDSGDQVYAVIRGSAVNNDGAAKVGYTAPGIQGQADVIAEAMALAGVTAEDVSYIEAHGTGTALGDPIEIEALSQVFRAQTDRRGFCALGTAKTNVGHLDAAAGIAGLIKTVLSLKHKKLPPLLHFERANPQIDFANSPFYVNTALSDWPATIDAPSAKSPRVAGVSSFGIGGTNAHVVVEEAPDRDPASPSRPWQTLMLSAKTETALQSAAANLARHLRDNPGTSLADAAFTLQVGRREFSYRQAVVCSGHEDAIDALELADAESARPLRAAGVAPTVYGNYAGKDRPVAFLFPGQGAQHVQMARGLYESERVFRDEIDQCANILADQTDLDLRAILYPGTENANEELLARTAITQPALFAVEYALAQLWISWGVRPRAMLGHSLGEYVAACLAGVFSLSDALALVAERGRLIQGMPAGDMLAVPLSEEAVADLLLPGISLAAVNAPAQCVLSGPREALAAAQASLDSRGIEGRILKTSHAFHSAMLDPIVAAFRERVAQVPRNAPRIPYLSNVTGTWITPDEAADPAYWATHLRRTVRFADGLRELLADHDLMLLEVGPGATLTSLAKQTGQDSAPIISSLPRLKDGPDCARSMATAVSRLWVNGASIDWDSYYADERRARVSLPTYPFERERYWIEPTSPAASLPARSVCTSVWKKSRLQQPSRQTSHERMVLFLDDYGVGERLAGRLTQAGHGVTVARIGSEYNETREGECMVRPGIMDDCAALLKNLARQGRYPDQIVFLASLGANRQEPSASLLSPAWAQLHALTLALRHNPPPSPVRLRIVANGMFDIIGDESTRPESAALFGLAKAVANSQPTVACQVVDLQLPDNPNETPETVIDSLFHEVVSMASDTSVAYRGRRRWTMDLESVNLDHSPETIREGGCYLITGGTDGPGLALAMALARNANAHLALVQPAPTAAAEADDIAAKLSRDSGFDASRLFVLRADVASALAMRDVAARVRRRFGTIHGVIHAANVTLDPSAGAQLALVTRVLGEVFAESPPDFIAFSLIAPYGSAGQEKQYAAEAILESLTEEIESARGLRCVGLHWAHGEEGAADAAVDALSRGLSAGLAQIIVSPMSTAGQGRGYPAALLNGRQSGHQETIPAKNGQLAISSQPRPGKAGYSAPTDETERVLAGIWGDLLGIAEIGIHDDFFDLGGHSLLATQVVSRIRQRFRVDVSLRVLFEAPTIATLAPLVAAGTVSSENRIQERAAGPAPLSFAQQQLWFIDQMDPGNAAYNTSVAVKLTGDLDVPALERSFNEVVGRHDILRTTFRLVDGQPTQDIADHLDLRIDVVDLSGLPDDERSREADKIMRDESGVRFDLTEAPLLRVRVLRLTDADHVVLLTMHHIISDGWSMGVLVQEIAGLYHAFVSDQAPSLPALQIQYADYAAWQRNRLTDETAQQRAYWTNALAQAPNQVDLPVDSLTPSAGPAPAGTATTYISPESTVALQELCHRNGTTLFAGLLAALDALLYLWTRQSDLVVGTVVAGRNRVEVEPLIGCFMNFLPLRSKLDDRMSGVSLLSQVKDSVADAYAHQELPFEQIVDAASPERRGGRNPLYNIALLLQNFPAPPVFSDRLRAEYLPLSSQAALLDLRLVATESADGVRLDCEYDATLFAGPTIEVLLESYIGIIDRLTADPNAQIGALAIPDALAAQQAASRKRFRKLNLCVAATFTAEPVEEPIAFWLDQIGMPGRVEFAPYDQVFQQLLDPESRMGQNDFGANVVLLRVEDWTDPDRNAADFIDAVTAAAARSAVPYLVFLCPWPGSSAQPGRERFVTVEERVASALSGVAGVYVTSSAELLERYPVEAYSDRYAEELGRIPYTPALYAALGTSIARKIHSLRRPPYKVIALDCDQTLWKGVAGEDGAEGVELDAPRLALQRFMVDQQNVGMLLCLLSKNEEADVRNVFDGRPEMPLKREHIVSSRINWDPKPANLRGLAEELELGLDSFIFVDDNPVECAQMRAECPEALTLELPGNVSQIPEFLRHVWAFDHPKTTAEDGKRTSMYRENVERKRLQTAAPSLADFLDGLELQIDIAAMTREQLPRVSQLTERTNQFNVSTRRRTESEIGEFLGRPENNCLTVSVRDRFGDYGLVGAMLYGSEATPLPQPLSPPGKGGQNGDDQVPAPTGQSNVSPGHHPGSGHLLVDTFLLSCRALGRGVEHRMLAALGDIAQTEGLAGVDIPYVPTAKNAPALNFLQSLVPTPAPSLKGREDEAGVPAQVFRFSAENAAATKYRPGGVAESSDGSDRSDRSGATISHGGGVAAQELLPGIAKNLARVEQIQEQMRRRNPIRASQTTPFTAPRSDVEERIAEAWREVLSIEQVGVHDSFFSLGGHSLQATQVVARIRENFGVDVPLHDLFDTPTIAGLADRVIGAQTTAVAQIGRRPAGAAPLSYSQQRVWFIDQMDPGNPAYNEPIAVRISGELDVVILTDCLNAVVARHDVLRTRFAVSDGQPFQEILASLAVVPEIIDLRGRPMAQREADAERAARETAYRPFDLATPPLLRVALLRMDAADHILLVAMHHIVSDGWSLGILVREIAAEYEARLTGKAPLIPELPIQYADFAYWQRQSMTGDTLAAQRTYWRRKLTGAQTVLDLPADRPRPAVTTFHGASATSILPRETVSALRALTQAEEATLFMALLSAWAALFHRYTGQSDIIVGSPIAARMRTEVEPLIGFFANTLPLRTEFDGGSTFRDLLRQIRATTLEAHANQDVPFEMLVEDLHVSRDTSRNPLFQVILALQNAPFPTLSMPGLSFRPHEIEASAAKFDIQLTVREIDGELHTSIVYNTDLFDRETVHRMEAHFAVLIQAAVANPDCRIARLPMLTDAETDQTLTAFNDTRRDYPRHRTIAEIFEEQAARTPQALALTFNDRHATYAELNARANRLAHHLRALGVGPDTPVGLCVERSNVMIEGILGILKAGGAYVPLDADYPPDRIAFMLSDSQAPVLLTTKTLLHRIPATHARIVCLDDEPTVEALAQTTDANPVMTPLSLEGRGVGGEGLTGPNHLAYIMFTSGSTGVPKGIQVPNQAVLRLVLSPNYIDLRPDDVFAQIASPSFDASVFEIWGALLNGARLVVVPRETVLSPPDLAALVARQGITTLLMVTTYFNELSRQAPDALRIRHVLFGGEAADPHFTRNVIENVRPGLLLNVYGPTETATFAAVHAIESVPDDALSVPIGRPISNTTNYVLDSHLQPVPVGVVGELYVGGDGLARGYLNRPDLTAASFIPDPFSTEPGSRLYKTGDLVRWIPDRTLPSVIAPPDVARASLPADFSGRERYVLDFLGRRDHQVKVRGFRIEIGEIETALVEHPDVEAALVAILGDVPGKRLVAYVVAKHGTELAATDLRALVKGRLPDYMTPSAYVFMEAFPVTPNGKVDRGALPVPRPESAEGYVSPRTDVEAVIAEIWAQVLSTERIGVHDNFFEIGGHSLLATQVVSRLRERLGVEIPLRELFEAPTVAELAERVQGANAASMVRIERRPEGPAELSFAQERLWFIEQMEPGNPGYNGSMAVRFTGHLDTSALRRSFDTVVARHEALRTRFPVVEGQVVPTIADSLTLEIPVIDLRHLPEGERLPEAERQAHAFALEPFDFQNGPMVRATLLRLSEDDHLLVVIVHHMVSDGWSMGVLVQEVATLYHAFARGSAPDWGNAAQNRGDEAELPALPVQYADFAHWQRQWLATAIESEQAYWTGTLSGAPDRIDLPNDGIRLPDDTPAGATTIVHIPKSTADAVRTLCREHDTTLFSGLLAALDIVLYRWTGQSDLVVGTVVANRNRSEIEPLIGCFMNFLPIRVAAHADENARNVVDRVKHSVTDAYAHADFPFEKIVEAVNPERKSQGNPIYNVGLLLQNFPVPPFFDDALRADFIPLHTNMALLDLRFVAMETDDGGVRMDCEYDAHLFEPATIDHLLAAYMQTLEALATDSDVRIGSLPVPRELAAQSDTARKRAREQTIAIAATFTAEPVEDSLAYWMREIGMPSRVEFAPYNQVFQQLLDPTSLMATNADGVNVLLVRLEDWIDPERNASDFVGALKSNAAGSPYIVCLCPPSPAAMERDAEPLSALENRVTLSLIDSSPEDRPGAGVRVITSAALLRDFPVDNYSDEYADELGHVPYTNALFAALGTAVSRIIQDARPAPYRAVTVDWDGITVDAVLAGMRRTLRARTTDREFVAPRNDEEAAIAQSWREVLGIEQIGIHDDFFALGGHSLQATQVVSRIREHFGVELTIRDLFGATTVAELAELVQGALMSQVDGDTVENLFAMMEEMDEAQVEALLAGGGNSQGRYP